LTAAHRRRAATGTDRPPAGPPGLHEGDGVPPPAGLDTGRVVDGRHGDNVDQHRDDDAEGRDLPAAAPGSSWRPRPTRPEELDDARAGLLVHRADPETGRCAACSGTCPCPEAQAAARVLARAGAWNALPFTGPVDWQACREPARGTGGWLARLVRCLSWAAGPVSVVAGWSGACRGRLR
jgi:hypothetical protein